MDSDSLIPADDGNRSQEVVLSDLSITVAGRELLTKTDLRIPAGKITVIVGGSGAGKSVLLRLLAGLVPQDDPAISHDGSISDADGQPLERVGIVFQQFALFDELSPIENVDFAIDHRRDRSDDPRHTAEHWLKELRVPVSTPVSALSGGQKQRLAIARTLAGDSEVVLYDEPTSGLDAASGRQVADLIQHTQQMHGRTSIVVTHDYETLIPIADSVLLLDSESKSLTEVKPDDWKSIPDRMRPVQTSPKNDEQKRPRSLIQYDDIKNQGIYFLEATGQAIIAALRLPWDALPRPPRIQWGFRFVAHYLWLIAGPSAWIYLILAGVIVGFASTYFTFRYLPFSLYTKPLLIEDLLASIGFALYRILVPVMATVLLAARCGAAAAADVSVKRYNSQVDALHTLGVRPTAYLLSPIVIAFVIGAPMLEWASFQAARLVSLATFIMSHPNVSPHFWELHFYDQLRPETGILSVGAGWVVLKTIACGIGIGVIAYYRGMRPKKSARDVSESITSTVLWTTLFVLLVHFAVAFLEF